MRQKTHRNGFLFLLLCSLLPMPALAQEYAGTYAGEVSGTPATLTLEQDGSTLQGIMDVSGYRYEVSATAGGAGATGTLYDPQTGGTVRLEMSPGGDVLNLVLIQENAFTGQMNRVPLAFSRTTGEGGASRGSGSTPTEGAGGGTPADGFERDPALVGTWVYQDTYISGSFSGTTRFVLRVLPDGSYTYGEGQVTAGDGSFSGSSGGGDVTQGRWRTQGSVVYIQEPGVSQWQPYARYYIEGSRMLFTFGDGSRQIWYRQ